MSLAWLDIRPWIPRAHAINAMFLVCQSVRWERVDSVTGTTMNLVEENMPFRCETRIRDFHQERACERKSSCEFQE